MPISRYDMSAGDVSPLKLRLLYVTYSKYEDDLPSMPHTHPFSELCYVIKGNGNYLIEDQIFPVKKDDFIIINTNIAHTEVSVGDIPLEYIILGVEGADFDFPDHSGHLIFNCSSENSDYRYIMQSLLSEMTKKGAGYRLICQDLLEVMVVRLTRHSSLLSSDVSSVKSSQECVKVKQYIESNYARAISLDDLAQISHLNKYYLVHAFTKCFGCSPMSFLCGIRLKASQELLASTDHNITQVAELSGFSSQSYFAQCFQKHCHMSPSAYRKKCRE